MELHVAEVHGNNNQASEHTEQGKAVLGRGESGTS